MPYGFAGQVDIPEGFFGINVASSQDPACDDYVIERLRELGIDQVRFDITSVSPATQRFLKRLLDEGFEVMLRLVPSYEQALKMDHDPTAQACWRDFLDKVFDVYGKDVAIFEIGSTPNRRRWSGHSYRGYLKLWEIACTAAKGRDLRLAGPNVSDFEPLHNIALLSWMGRVGRLPDVQTDNLFVERVIEPEAFDHRVAGAWATRLLGFNLVKKSRVLKDIADRYSIPATYCTHTCWSSRRLQRWGVDTEAKKADYLVRYAVMAAAGGALQRLYWGPLIGHRDGLIDDGTNVYAATERVTRYGDITGQIEDYKPGAAFYALANVVGLLKGARLLSGVSANNGLFEFEFARPDARRIRVAWTRDRAILPLAEVYGSALIDKARFIDCEGRRLAHQPFVITERPVFMVLDDGEPPSARVPEHIARAPSLHLPNTVFASLPGLDFMPWRNSTWRGAIAVRHGEDAAQRATSLSPEALEKTCDRLIRDKRNRVWSIQDPLCQDRRILVVKRIRVRGLKRLTYRFVTNSKAKRNWNNASEMLRLGVTTPLPVAFFEQHQDAVLLDSYYVCEYAEHVFSARQAFEAFRAGKDELSGFSKPHILEAIACYIWYMHSRNIIHADLSSGNLLLQRGDDGHLRVSAIDIGRSRRVKGRMISQRERFLDLMRICYKLDWPDREDLLRRYFKLGNLSVPRWARIPLLYYERKTQWKRRLQGYIKTRR